MVHSLYGVENPLDGRHRPRRLRLPGALRKHPGTMHLVEYAEIAALLTEIALVPHRPGRERRKHGAGRRLAVRRGGAVLRDEVLGPSVKAPRGRRARPCSTGPSAATPRERVRSRMSRRVHPALVRKGTPTGTSVILVTPDGERTMNTFLGACRDFTVGDLDLARLAESRMLYLTGYLWDTENQRRGRGEAAAFARADGRDITIAFDLADPFAVRRFGEKLRLVDPAATSTCCSATGTSLPSSPGAPATRTASAEAMKLSPWS